MNLYFLGMTLKKQLFVVFLLCKVMGYAQDSHWVQDTLVLKKMFNTLNRERKFTSEDATVNNAKLLFHSIEKLPEEVSTSPTFYNIQKVCLSKILSYYVVHKKQTLLLEMLKHIDTTPSISKFSVYGKFYLAKYRIANLDYFKGIKLFYEALTTFKELNDTNYVVKTHLLLAKSFRKIEIIDLSKEVDSILMTDYYTLPLSKNLKNRIVMNHASFKSMTGNTRESLDILKKIQEDNFIDHSYVKKFYFKELLDCYLKLNELDSASYYVEKVFNNPKFELPDDFALAEIYKARISLQRKNFKQAKLHIENARRSNSLAFVDQFHIINLQRTEALAHKGLKNYRDALYAYEAYLNVRDAVKNYNLNMKTSILNFKLNRDKKILKLEEEVKLKEILYKEKRKVYMFFTFLITCLVLLFFFYGYYTIKKKEQLKLILEYDKIKELTTFKTKFIENLSHEINTPITIVLGYLSLISDHPTDYKKILEYSKASKKSMSNIETSVKNLLTLSKLETNKFTGIIEKLALGKFLKEVVCSFESVVAVKSMVLYYRSNISLLHKVNYDYNSLKKIVNNLISNAIKYSKEHTSIYIDLTVKQHHLFIEVKDEGVGIDTLEKEQIFDRFYQSNQNQLYGGFGIGLSLVKTLVTQLNGSVSVESERNMGSVFTVILPIEFPTEQLSTTLPIYENILQHSIVKSPQKNNNRPSILVVDDNPDITTLIREILSPHYFCDVAFNGEGALNKIKAYNFDVILSDYRMPVMNGYDLKLALNNSEDYSKIPFILMTTSVKEYLMNSESQLGINDFLIKPFTNKELTVRMHHILEKNMYLSKLQNSEESESVEFESSFSQLMDNVNRIILENVSNSDFKVSELAEQCGYSHKQFTKIIKVKSGLSPVKLILEIRLKKAYDLILRSQYQSINEVIYAVGLNSRSYFNKVFTDRFGVKPGELLKKKKF